MRLLIVIANPNQSSFSHAMAATAKDALLAAGSAIALHDLYAERFDPVQLTGEAANTRSSDLLVEQHCSELANADLILVFHPNWWGQPPAIMKGWIDRVFRLNTAYGYLVGVGPDGVPVGLLRARQALVFNTSNTPIEREQSVFGDPLDSLWKNCVFGLCGVTNVARRMYAPASGSSDQQRASSLIVVNALVAQAAQEALRKSHSSEIQRAE